MNNWGVDYSVEKMILPFLYLSIRKTVPGVEVEWKYGVFLKESKQIMCLVRSNDFVGRTQ